MINEFFVFMGIIILTMSTIVCLRIITKAKEKISWMLVFTLIAFFLAGYIIYFILHLKTSIDFYGGDFLEGQILFWGSVFVILVLFVSKKMLNDLIQSIENLQSMADSYQKQKETLEKIRLKISEKNQKLEDIVEGFYDYRLDQETENPDKKIISDNIQIKSKIDKLKNKK